MVDQSLEKFFTSSVSKSQSSACAMANGGSDEAPEMSIWRSEAFIHGHKGDRIGDASFFQELSAGSLLRRSRYPRLCDDRRYGYPFGRMANPASHERKTGSAYDREKGWKLRFSACRIHQIQYDLDFRLLCFPDDFALRSIIFPQNGPKLFLTNISLLNLSFMPLPRRSSLEGLKFNFFRKPYF